MEIREVVDSETEFGSSGRDKGEREWIPVQQ